MKQSQHAARIHYLNRFNIDTVRNLQGWPDARLEQAVDFVKSEIKPAKSRV